MKGEISKKEEKEVIKKYFDGVKKQLKMEGKARLGDLGIIRIKVRKARKARMGHNPATGEPMKIKAKPKVKVAKFRPSRELRNDVKKWRIKKK